MDFHAIKRCHPLLRKPNVFTLITHFNPLLIVAGYADVGGVFQCGATDGNIGLFSHVHIPFIVYVNLLTRSSTKTEALS